VTAAAGAEPRDTHPRSTIDGVPPHRVSPETTIPVVCAVQSVFRIRDATSKLHH